MDFELWEFLAEMDDQGLLDKGEYFVITMEQTQFTDANENSHFTGKSINRSIDQSCLEHNLHIQKK